MKTAANRIIVSQENIENTIIKLNGLDEKGYENLLNRFMKEQPGLLEFAGYIDKDYSKKFFNAFSDIMVIIWMAFEDASGKVPVITGEIFEKATDNPRDEFEKIGELLNIKDEKILLKKLEDFNRLIGNIGSEVELVKLKKQMGKDFDIITGVMFNYLEEITQKELYSFIMEECQESEISTAKKPNQEDKLAEELLFVMKCFDEAVNFKPKLKISK
jgi:hypothetical protein